MPNVSSNFHNIHGMAGAAMIDGAHLCSGELANHLGLDLHGHIHNALYDVLSIALALNQWMQQELLPVGALLDRSNFAHTSPHKVIYHYLQVCHGSALLR